MICLVNARITGSKKPVECNPKSRNPQDKPGKLWVSICVFTSRTGFSRFFYYRMVVAWEEGNTHDNPSKIQKKKSRSDFLWTRHIENDRFTDLQTPHPIFWRHVIFSPWRGRPLQVSRVKLHLGIRVTTFVLGSLTSEYWQRMLLGN